MKRKPSTPQEWAAYRAQLSASIAADAINGNGVPSHATPEEWALYNIAQAIQDIAKIHFDPNQKP